LVVVEVDFLATVTGFQDFLATVTGFHLAVEFFFGIDTTTTFCGCGNGCGLTRSER
jgi:hypothetical protein